MKANDNEIFREGTLRICGNLDIEKAMSSFIRYLKGFMPADGLFMLHYDKSFNAMRTIVAATQDTGKRVDNLAPLSPEAEEFIKTEFVTAMLPVHCSNRPHDITICRELLAFHHQEAASLLALPLGTASQFMGYVVLVSEEELYTKEHARLFSLLREPFATAMSNVLKHWEILKLKQLLVDENRYLHSELKTFSRNKIVGAKFGLKEVVYKAQQVAVLDSPVLILGETGVGKDVIANMIHQSSPRSDGPFVSVNCGAIPDTLIDSELFGHEKGAFTGALSKKIVRFERAHKGTIFLDEIGELPLKAQVRLLRVLQSKEIERVGGSKIIPLDIRIIAATNRNLHEMVTNKQFREDLWFRLNVFPIFIPPLRERRSDIPALFQHFIGLKSKELKLSKIPELTPGAIEPLMNYDWPGNVREIANVVERALITSTEGPISFKNVMMQENNFHDEEQTNSSDGLNCLISKHIRGVLLKTEGRINGPGGAAELLEINPNTLRNKMDKLNIEYGRK